MLGDEGGGDDESDMVSIASGSSGSHSIAPAGMFLRSLIDEVVVNSVNSGSLNVLSISVVDLGKHCISLYFASIIYIAYISMFLSIYLSICLSVCLSVSFSNFSLSNIFFCTFKTDRTRLSQAVEPKAFNYRT